MAHHLVRYIWHVRRELERVLDGISEADLNREVHLNDDSGSINSIAWMIGHLAMQEQAYWLLFTGNELVDKNLKVYGGKVEDAKDFAELFELWKKITEQSNAWLETATPKDLENTFEKARENTGSLMTRVIGHYYFHIGQIATIRKLLGYDVPSFVGSQEGAYYTPENS